MLMENHMTLQLPLSGFILNPIDMDQVWKWLAMGVMQPPDIHAWKQTVSLSVFFFFFLSLFLQGIPEAPAAEVYSACKDGHKAGFNVEKHFWQYLLGHYDQCQTLSSVALNSIKV